jgi:tRNA(Arg) A34 adenosine deaminase TadA
MFAFLLSYGLLFFLYSVIVLVLLMRFHSLKRNVHLDKNQFIRLLELAQRSLESFDVPVGAILIYKNKIIGEGYNTVLRASSAGGHAEINAISDALQRIGQERFSSLERDSLFLVTTFEPCLMCAGAFINYNIRQVYFLKEKDFNYLSKEGLQLVRYYFQRGKIKHSGEQDTLFEQHPRYPLRKVNADRAR